MGLWIRRPIPSSQLLWQTSVWHQCLRDRLDPSRKKMLLRNCLDSSWTNLHEPWHHLQGRQYHFNTTVMMFIEVWQGIQATLFRSEVPSEFCLSHLFGTEYLQVLSPWDRSLHVSDLLPFIEIPSVVEEHFCEYEKVSKNTFQKYLPCDSLQKQYYSYEVVTEIIKTSTWGTVSKGHIIRNVENHHFCVT